MKKFIFCIGMIIIIGFILVINGPQVLPIEEESLEKRSIFISYIELGKYLKGKTESESKENISLMVENVLRLGFNEVIVQVRSFCDSIYPSSIFPWSSVVSSGEGVSYSYDILDYFIEAAHKKNISFIAWINPYRVRSNTNIGGISDDSPAFQYIGTDYLYVGNGIYFNPSKIEVRELIENGVREIVKKYKVDGILFDDYFYPNNEIDRDDYNKYLENNTYITKDIYNLNIVSEMIKNVYAICREHGVKFGVSPDGNMENNYNKVYADVKRWCSSGGFVDFIMPQVYYGFLNERKGFKSVIEEWESIITNESVEFRVALSFYKVGTIDNYAKSGMYEWMQYDDIIMREIVMSRNLKKYSGFSLFRYDYLFNDDLYNEMTLREIENMKKVLN